MLKGLVGKGGCVVGQPRQRVIRKSDVDPGRLDRVRLAAAAADGDRRTLRLDGVVVRTAPDPLTGLESYDAPTLMHLAGEALRNERPELALLLYERLLLELPESPLALSAGT